MDKIDQFPSSWDQREWTTRRIEFSSKELTRAWKGGISFDLFLFIIYGDFDSTDRERDDEDQ